MEPRNTDGPRPVDPWRPGPPTNRGPGRASPLRTRAALAAAVLCIVACEYSQLVYLGRVTIHGFGDEALLARAADDLGPRLGPARPTAPGDV